MNSEKPVPLVFISYSHDNPDHKRWVLELATQLRQSGVDVVLDAWDLRPGDDIPKFMERGVRAAGRVLMICTELYVSKANDGVGGVGYEAMIVTGELIRDLGTAKFIPVIRQSAKPPLLPASVSTRFYLDMSDSGQEGVEFQKLLRELHGAPLLEKPALGENPFCSTPSVTNAAVGESESRSAQKVSALVDPTAAYDLALPLANSGDVASWRSVVRRAREGMEASLEIWWSKYGTQQPTSVELIIEQSLEGAVAFAPLMAIAIAGVSSGNQKFRSHAGLLEDILNPSEWQRSGYLARVELPELGGYLFQAVHGAFALHAGDMALAINLATTPTTTKKGGPRIPVWQRHDLTAWPESLGKNASESWKTLFGLAARWQWVGDIFGDVSTFQECVVAYYMALGLLEYVELIRGGNAPPTDKPGNMYLDVPPVYEVAAPEVKRRAYRILIDSGLKVWLVSSGVDVATIRRHWKGWIAVQNYWHHQLYPFSTGELANERLVPDILGD